ncbi:GNAT domain-containing protein [Chytriomyces cf. hyalinus JEL632]|nr:GNAT domain-containing protein [Chytriomyces cf. hyalinus JEL632]
MKNNCCLGLNAGFGIHYRHVRSYEIQPKMNSFQESGPKIAGNDIVVEECGLESLQALHGICHAPTQWMKTLHSCAMTFPMTSDLIFNSSLNFFFKIFSVFVGLPYRYSGHNRPLVWPNKSMRVEPNICTFISTRLIYFIHTSAPGVHVDEFKLIHMSFLTHAISLCRFIFISNPVQEPRSLMSSMDKSYTHLPTNLLSHKHPLLLRTLLPEDSAAFAQILSDPRNTEFESDSVPRKMDLATAAMAISRMRDSAAQPTIVAAADGKGKGKVVSGPTRVNMAIVYLGDATTPDGRELASKGGLMIGIGGFGAIKNLSPSSGEPVPEAAEGQEATTTTSADFLRVGDVGAMINREYRGRGFAHEAMRLAMEWGFKKAADGGLQLDKVTATTLADNKPMIAVLSRKIGWEGKTVPATEPEGKDEVYYEMSVEEWEARK